METDANVVEPSSQYGPDVRAQHWNPKPIVVAKAKKYTLFSSLCHKRSGARRSHLQ